MQIHFAINHATSTGKVIILVLVLLLSLIYVSASADVEINESNFPDPLFRYFFIDLFDKDRNGTLSDKEIGNVTEINCSSKSISDLTGIEYFVALESLDCHGNQLTSLDVTKLTSLDDLNCASNRLTELDVSHNTELKNLYCDLNRLTSLDVSQNTTLFSLGCSYNLLESLDVSQNVELMYLSCYGNPLTSLDLSHNTKLLDEIAKYGSLYTGTLIQVGYRDKRRSNWDPLVLQIDNTVSVLPEGTIPGSLPEPASADVEINERNFPDANFRQYIIDAGFDTDGNGKLNEAEIWNVAEIDCSSKSISNLTGIDFFTALKKLSCYSNSLTSIDVSENTVLESLDCHDNLLTVIYESRSTALKDLNCANNLLYYLDVDYNTGLKNLYCDNNRLLSLDVSQNTELLYLSCSHNLFTSLDLSHNTKLLDEIAKYEIQDTGSQIQVGYLDKESYTWNPLVLEIDNIVTVLPEGTIPGPVLADVEINETNFPDANFRQYIIDSGFDSDGNGTLSKEEIGNVTGIRCSSKSISDLTGIEYFTLLRKLDCSDNQLTNLDVSKNRVLKDLNCARNQLTSLDVSQNTVLSNLWCYYNQLTQLDLTKNELLLYLLNNYYGPGIENGVITLGVKYPVYPSYRWLSRYLMYDSSVRILHGNRIPTIPSFIIDDSTTTIESEAFAGLTDKIFILPSTITFIADDAFDPTAQLYVPKDSYAAARCKELRLNVIEIK